MARFQFRLEASLRLAEQALEKAQREFAQEVQRWQACVHACMVQQERFDEAQEGQRDAGRHRPEELGVWQVFTLEQRKRLTQYEEQRIEQESVVDNARGILLEVHREVEKFQRLKDKQAKAFQWAELQREQKILDETGQVLHWRQQTMVE
ncbi:flagellar FliJ family protein [Desulfosporosinus sp. Sb-LF]|uniref:flagellar FliJ family protein n=1 Tax=Desulfosporosinus sp. Sb-LF TaxID=2560027 RepID=UPI00107F8DCC|nr:flagellar FliJ family protein [Desulfosporosinus sp. Sb-LF]TGE32616.1 flagellar export protein FliJ [Desulfosporosinus sp. Sb-LF]